jgi:lipoate-protein ligase B
MNVKDLGLIDYRQAWALQQEYVEKVVQDRDQGYLLLCEHPPVLTLGRLADRSHILYSENELQERRIAIIPIDRGGEVTLHAPGQLVVYPIFNLESYGKDLHHYLHKLEDAGIDFLTLFGIVGNRISGKTGVWVGDQKVMSIGIGVRKWVSFHGIAMNVNTDLALFRLIRPCGMDVQTTSVSRELNCPVEMADAKEKMVVVFKKIFGG